METSMTEVGAPQTGEPPARDEWGSLPPEDVVRKLKTHATQGLSFDEAAVRLARVGLNEVAHDPGKSALSILVHQFLSSVVVLLLVAAGISFLTGEHLQAAGILAAVAINAIVGFATEYKAKISLEALREISAPTARVRRDGRDCSIPARELVPGDVVLVEAGNRMPADIRFLECASLTVDESILNGESAPVYKSAELVASEDHSSTLGFHGTYTLKGRARGVVVETGAKTRLGHLQCLLSSTEAGQTPLERRLETLGTHMSVLCVVICVALTLVGIFHQQNIWHMLETSIALAVAAIPEGLPVVATLALALGTQRMVKLGVLIRELSAVETLGCTTVVCSDKTGTLTENQMIVTDIVLSGHHIQVTGQGYTPEGEFNEAGRGLEAKSSLTLVRLLEAVSLCNDARLEKDREGEVWQAHGDPTEGALLALAIKAGLKQSELSERYPRVDERPFDLTRKLMTTIHSTADGDGIAFVKGSPEVILQASSRIQKDGELAELTEEEKTLLLDENMKLAEGGLRVLGAAMKRSKGQLTPAFISTVEEELDFLGLVAMRDLPRTGVKEALKKCHRAGIQVIMLTGDQPATARSIARDLNIVEKDSPESAVILGADMEQMSDKQTEEACQRARVMARVTPQMKLRIVRALQQKGEVVAMTGDGVNDAPALRQSNIGVAMGLCGTDLAREASNMVITDDNFSTIVTAIEQGRIIYENIKRAICYLLTATIASLITISLAILVNDPLPLTPLQLLWLNLIMHVFPALGIVMQQAASDLMKQAPRDPAENILGLREYLEIFGRGIIVSLSVLTVIQLLPILNMTATSITSICFTTISLALLYQAWAWLGLGQKDGVRPNIYMHVNMVVSYGLIFLALYVPPFSTALQTKPLTGEEWALALGSATVFFGLSNLASFILSKVLKASSRKQA